MTWRQLNNRENTLTSWGSAQPSLRRVISRHRRKKIQRASPWVNLELTQMFVRVEGRHRESYGSKGMELALNLSDGTGLWTDIRSDIRC